jgi:hypothetical protein
LIAQTPCLGGTTTTPPTTTPAPTGACCWMDFDSVDPNTFCPLVVCEVLSETECVARPFGVWHEGETCDDPDPCVRCTTSTTSPPTTTTAPVGACCVGETCVNDVTAAYCVNVLFGTYMGDGVPCGPSTCTDPCTGTCNYEWNGVTFTLIPEETTCTCVCFPPTTPAPGDPVMNPYAGSCLSI